MAIKRLVQSLEFKGTIDQLNEFFLTLATQGKVVLSSQRIKKDFFYVVWVGSSSSGRTSIGDVTI